MSAVLPLARMLSRPSRQGRAAIVLPIVAFAVTTALLLVVAGGARMFLVDPRAVAGGFYGTLAVLALVLLAVPLATLGAAAARLSSRRRNDRLATLRLLGASGREIWSLTVLEATATAVIGALAGVVLYAALLPAVGMLPFFGGPIGVGAVAADPLLVAAVVAVVIAIAAVSAAAGLRRVTVTPLGVRTRQSAPPKRTWVLVVGGILIALVVLAVANVDVFGPAASTAVLLALFGAGLGLLNLVGAPIIAARGRAMARNARTAARLIAGRELAAHAGPAWRRVSGMALVSFIAVVAGCGLALVGLSGDVDTMLLDIRTGVLVTLGIAFVLLACAVGVTQASAALEDRELIVGLDRLGIPDAELRRARRLTVMVPLRWAAIGGAALGAVLAFPVVGLSLVAAPLSVATVAGTFVAGFALVAAALASTRPIVTGIRRGTL
ncbi:FtsX-like permease family protein [Microbacterium sp.]|uniref:FtsX-like permease family protein n=1 Tax=Microbacterium sp. TaxID=51671 RepID=UPI0025F77F60|nr:FtsX-like permease family protein [Microbacterium sp.]